ncbi:hypothetical protein PC120_g11052 [Phytophthora cactorum]|nr:hypothetical protein PC120_g11052 [Phytophthora cactorum]
MMIPDEIKRRLGVTGDTEIVLELKKALRRGSVLLVVGVYVADLLVTGTQQEAVDAFFGELAALPIKDLGPASKFLGMQVSYSEEDGYDLDQEVTITDMLREHGMEFAREVRSPIGEAWNERREDKGDALPVSGVVTILMFQSVVGSLMWVARCTRPDIAFAVHKAWRRTHKPTTDDWKLAKRIMRYVASSKGLQLCMRGGGWDRRSRWRLLRTAMPTLQQTKRTGSLSPGI